MMSVSRAIGERAIAGRRTDHRREDSCDEERWRSPSAGHTLGNFAKVKQIPVLHVDQCLELFFSGFLIFIFD